MKYKYIDKHGRLLAESDSPITFNKELFPAWQDIKPVTGKPKAAKSAKTVAIEKPDWNENKEEGKE